MLSYELTTVDDVTSLHRGGIRSSIIPPSSHVRLLTFCT